MRRQMRKYIPIVLLVIHRLANNRAGHAMPATAAAPQLCRADLHYLNAGSPQFLVGVLVAVIGHHHARFNGHDVVGIIPLLTRGGINIPTCFNDLEASNTECLGYDIEEGVGGQFDVERRRACGGVQHDGPDGVHNLGVGSEDL